MMSGTNTTMVPWTFSCLSDHHHIVLKAWKSDPVCKYLYIYFT